MSRNLNKSVTLRLKVKPEDFIVEEIANIPIKKEGGFCAYLLKKRGWNTVDLTKKLSKDFHIPFSDFSYGGRKDRYALTTQYITIARRSCNQIAQINSLQFPQPSFAKEALGVSNKGRLRGICEENYSLDFAGRMDRPMGPDLVIDNRFEITIRSLTEYNLKSALSKIDVIKKYGYPNYFDDQRFGSFDPRQGFIAEKILRKHYNGALKIYLTHIRPEDSKEEKVRKRSVFENWGNWQFCLETAKSRFEKASFEYLIKEPREASPSFKRYRRRRCPYFFLHTNRIYGMRF